MAGLENWFRVDLLDLSHVINRNGAVVEAHGEQVGVQVRECEGGDTARGLIILSAESGFLSDQKPISPSDVCLPKSNSP